MKRSPTAAGRNRMGPGDPRRIALAALLPLLPLSFAAADDAARARPALAVFDFDFAESNAPTGKHVAEEVLGYLQKTERFQLLERNELRSIIDESRITDEMIAKGETDLFGRLRDCDYLLFGDIADLRDDTLKIGKHRTSTVTLRGTFRLVDRSGKRILSGSFEVSGQDEWKSGDKPTHQRYRKLISDHIVPAAGAQIGWSVLSHFEPLRISNFNPETGEATLNYGAPHIRMDEALRVSRYGARNGDSAPLGFLVVDHVAESWARGRVCAPDKEGAALAAELDRGAWKNLAVAKTTDAPPCGRSVRPREWNNKWYTRRGDSN